MKVFISGGTGFVGTALTRALRAAGHDLTLLVHHTSKKHQLPNDITVVSGDAMKEGSWQQQISKTEAVINLIGANIFAKWTPEYKKLIHDSRVLSTKHIVDAIEASENNITLINASAAGYYGFCGDEKRYEDAPPGDDFLARVCVDWENEAKRAEKMGGKVIITRFGVVLGDNGGALAKMLPAFKMGVGGRLGEGRQWFPWIHIEDLAAGIIFLMDSKNISGPVNLCSPNPVRNSELTETLGKVLHRPTLLSVPKFVLKLKFGEMASVVLESTRMMPGVLTNNKFPFRFPDLLSALTDLLAHH